VSVGSIFVWRAHRIRCSKKAIPAMLLDLNCEHGGAELHAIRGVVEEFANSLENQKTVFNFVAAYGGSSVLSRFFARQEQLAAAECPIGWLCMAAASLLSCLLSGRVCRRLWNHLAFVMRRSMPSTARWHATTWPFAGLLAHVTHIAHSSQSDDPTCSFGGNHEHVNWPQLRDMATRVVYNPHLFSEEVNDELISAHRKLSRLEGRERLCAGGQHWVRTVHLVLCIRRNPLCADTWIRYLDSVVKTAVTSGAALRDWAIRAGSWSLIQSQQNMLSQVLAHRQQLGLTPAELQILGLGTPRCADLRASELLWLASGRCKIQCQLWANQRSIMRARLLIINGREHCKCIEPPAYGVLNTSITPSNCTAGQMLLYEMPVQRHVLADMDMQGMDLWRPGPVVEGALRSLRDFDLTKPVLITMVFGVLTKYLLPFMERAHRLQIVNVVVFTMDDSGQAACLAAEERIRSRDYATEGQRGAWRATCLQGQGRSCLQKFVGALVYVSLGRDVFYFDFDSVWLKNPFEALRAAVESKNSPLVLTGGDLASECGASNSIFFVKATDMTANWLSDLVSWYYRRPHVNDMVAWASFLEGRPLDPEPMPPAPRYAYLDANLFVNARRFGGRLGFSGSMEDIVHFHFFYGYNSGQGDEVEQWATQIYKGMELFEVLYGDDQVAAWEAINRSWVPPYEDMQDCSLSSFNTGMA